MHSRVLAERNAFAQESIDKSISAIALMVGLKNLPSKQTAHEPNVKTLLEREYFATVLKMIAEAMYATDPEAEIDPEAVSDPDPEPLPPPVVEPDPDPEPEEKPTRATRSKKTTAQK